MQWLPSDVSPPGSSYAASLASLPPQLAGNLVALRTLAPFEAFNVGPCSIVRLFPVPSALQRAQALRHVLSTQATGKGIGRPSFRVIQNHFAARNNVGDIAAKEEVWEARTAH